VAPGASTRSSGSPTTSQHLRGPPDRGDERWSPPRVKAGSVEEFLAAVDRVVVNHRAEVEPATLLAELVPTNRELPRLLADVLDRLAEIDKLVRSGEE
jgi:hypothetical protein